MENVEQKKQTLKLRRGLKIGKYRLIKRIGRGGYSQVWKAKDNIEGIHVALKIPHPAKDGKPDNQTLLKEIRHVAQIQHKNIMPVKNADIIDGQAILATEISTRTLEECSRPMSVKRIINIMSQILEALAYAHSKGMVHCDVTPGNIFLFPDGRVALGDFGISVKFEKKMATLDEFGTPGYVAPEQAYGKPTCRSDCFAVAVILYEYITGYLPRWPFTWPFRAHRKLTERTGTNFVKFMKKALAIDPAKRFTNASQMLAGLAEATPKKIRAQITKRPEHHKTRDWRKVRRQFFIKRYSRVFEKFTQCCNCGEPVAEAMACCPWCGTQKNRFDNTTAFDHICPDCHKGVLDEWRFCPYCYGPGFKSSAEVQTKSVKYHTKCKHCGGKIMRFMKYCPWCHRKIKQKWQISPFPEVCGNCGWSVDSGLWNYCPWCKTNLHAD